MSGAILAVVAAGLTWALMARGRRVGAARRHRRFARSPAVTFVFADLVGYGSFTDRRGDEAAMRVAWEFGRLMRSLSHEHGAWHVKSMGDGAMICVPDAGQAVALAKRTLTEVGAHPDLLPVRIGAHTGPAVLHDGDWYGGAVNVAARLVSIAQPNQALVSDSTRDAAGVRERRFLARRDVVGLRGVSAPVGVWPLAAERREQTLRRHHDQVSRWMVRGPR
ncbi:MAG TPA: adenylate/guanylate cyclase domain-containing protein [Solirubrobacteraceae bacterium]|nr:adenylate/guanylate cyclase domain-containing protein [Solirubrobacteraceae bacterium]